MTARLLAFFCCATIVLSPCTGRAWDDLDIRSWLGDPGVKLLAVEFYATWCKPCQEAVPKWKKLQKKYRAKGLRLVVVAVQSEGSCSSPDWVPDRVVCDGDGSIAQRWRAQDLPQAFLWSWQGNPLVANGSVEQVEAAIKDYFGSVPRILVAAPEDLRGDPLPKKIGRQVKQLVRSELKRASKFDLVADKKERDELRKLRKAGHAVNFDEDTQCKLGEEVSPNSQLKITVAETRRGTKLRLELFSLEKGCLTASAHAPVIDKDYEAAAVEAVAKLVRGLLGDVKVPGGAATAVVRTVPDSPGPGSGPAPGGYEEFLVAAEAAKRKNKTLENAWNVVDKVVQQEGLKKEHKVAALEKFIADFPKDNPYVGEAERLRDRLTLGAAVGTSWLTLGVTGGPVPGGVTLEAFRFRYKNFQWSVLEFHFELATQFLMGGGLLGLGYKWNMGAAGKHEFGFMSFPLSYAYADVTVYNADTGNSDEYDYGSICLLNTKLYYRLNFTHWHLEAGILTPLFWLGSYDDWNHEDDSYDSKPYQGVFPALYYFSGGF